MPYTSEKCVCVCDTSVLKKLYKVHLIYIRRTYGYLSLTAPASHIYLPPFTFLFFFTFPFYLFNPNTQSTLFVRFAGVAGVLR